MNYELVLVKDKNDEKIVVYSASGNEQMKKDFNALKKIEVFYEEVARYSMQGQVIKVGVACGIAGIIIGWFLH